VILPFAVIDADGYEPIVLLGSDENGLVGLEYPSADLYALEPEDILAVVSIDPSAVFYGLRVARSEFVAPERMVANPARRRLPRFVTRGEAFPLLPEGELSGFPTAARTMRKHREQVPSLDTIRVSALFAVSTIRTSIEQAELAFECFGGFYRKHGRQMPTVQEIKTCFRGLQNSKARMFSEVADYASVIRQVLETGYQDREARSVLALDTNLPVGLGLTKLSFTLALLGHDCICLDGRLLGVLFPRKIDRVKFEDVIGKERGRVSERALLAYEKAEDTFLAGNPHYDPNDPLGRARAQWTSWEAVGGKGAEHRVWLDLLPEEEK